MDDELRKNDGKSGFPAKRSVSRIDETSKYTHVILYMIPYKVTSTVIGSAPERGHSSSRKYRRVLLSQKCWRMEGTRDVIRFAAAVSALRWMFISTL